MIDTPRIVRTEAQRTAMIRLTVPRAEMPLVMGPAIQELMAAVTAQGTGPTGHVHAHHLRMDEEVFDFEVGVPVSGPIAAAGRVRQGELPAAAVARTIYHGPYEGLPGAWGEFMAWIEAQGRTPGSDFWEVYTHGPHTSPDPSEWRTELNRPLVDAP